jgi:hypothetical protein
MYRAWKEVRQANQSRRFRPSPLLTLLPARPSLLDLMVVCVCVFGCVVA